MKTKNTPNFTAWNMRSIIILLLLSAGINHSCFAQWMSVNSNTSNHLYGVFFQSNEVGYVVGAQGTILKTTDAGNNWSPLNSGVTTDLKGIWFTNETTGYVVGGGGVILKTTDAGALWTPRASGSAGEFTSVQFVNSDNGFVAGIGIYKTLDSAFSWTASPGNTNYYTSLCFVNDSVGFVLELFGKILRTTDRGNTWTNVSPIMGGDPVYDIYFPSETVGYVVGRFGRMMKTTDGGNTWVLSFCPSRDDLNAVHFLDDQVGYAAGVKSIISTILKTTDGGATWTFENANITVNLNALCFTPDQTGFAIGKSGIILKKAGSGVGIADTGFPGAKIYPNPAESMLRIELAGSTNATLEIINLAGEVLNRVLLQKRDNSVNVEYLPSGTYVLKVIAPEGVCYKKLIKV
ncbi:MAG: T9SS type A sorting domain-containing protein [Bacteroidales bacterium]|nr:T9SS type A sorting domain-containing protein [Bacteroidales bacterium]